MPICTGKFITSPGFTGDHFGELYLVVLRGVFFIEVLSVMLIIVLTDSYIVFSYISRKFESSGLGDVEF
jgi:hypothetical protein